MADYFEVKMFPGMCCAPAAVLWSSKMQYFRNILFSAFAALFKEKKSQQSAFPLFASELLEHVYLLTKDCLIS